ncbi:MAG: hypothetical protein WA733_07760 [Methylocystis sp.]
MRRWFRAVTVFLVLLALFAGGTGGAWAGKATHKCERMAAGMVMDDCMQGHGDEGGVIPSCPPMACVSAQIFLLSQDNFLTPIVIRLVSASLPSDEPDLGGLSGPPDLRPPIA